MYFNELYYCIREYKQRKRTLAAKDRKKYLLIT